MKLIKKKFLKPIEKTILALQWVLLILFGVLLSLYTPELFICDFTLNFLETVPLSKEEPLTYARGTFLLYIYKYFLCYFTINLLETSSQRREEPLTYARGTFLLYIYNYFLCYFTINLLETSPQRREEPLTYARG
jgi:uncharacterized membrane protein (DUF106 family)